MCHILHFHVLILIRYIELPFLDSGKVTGLTRRLRERTQPNAFLTEIRDAQKKDAEARETHEREENERRTQAKKKSEDDDLLQLLSGAF